MNQACGRGIVGENIDYVWEVPSKMIYIVKISTQKSVHITFRFSQATTRIDHKKADNIIPQRWIINCLKMYKISVKVIKFLKEAMKS